MEDEEWRLKNGGSLSLKLALVSCTSLFDVWNHCSALLLSPELFLPSGCRLEGDPLLFFDPLLPVSFPFVALEALLSLEVSLSLGLFRLCDDCFRDTDRCAGGRRGCPEDDALLGCAGGVMTIVGGGSLEAICGKFG